MVREWVARFWVSRIQVDAYPEETRGEVLRRLTEQLPDEVRGPRGGRYIATAPMGPISNPVPTSYWPTLGIGLTSLYVASRPYRYVRPGR